MRFALIATAVVAIAAIPVVGDSLGPRLEGHAFLGAVRSVAYESVNGRSADLGAARYWLNAEARRQPPETAAQARAEASAIAREAAGIVNRGDAAILNDVGASACADAGAQIARGAGAADAA